MRFRVGGYAHAKQFERLRKVVRRQRTIVGILIREIRRKMLPISAEIQTTLTLWLARAQRLVEQQPKDKNKLYALHAPEVECIGKGKAKKPYEFGVKVRLAPALKKALIVGIKSFPNNPYDGHTLAEQIEQTNNLLIDQIVSVKTAYVDLGNRGVDASLNEVKLIHRGKIKSLTKQQRKGLKRRQAIEPIIGHVKQDRHATMLLERTNRGRSARDFVRIRLQYSLAPARDHSLRLQAFFCKHFFVLVHRHTEKTSRQRRLGLYLEK